MVSRQEAALLCLRCLRFLHRRCRMSQSTRILPRLTMHQLLIRVFHRRMQIRVRDMGQWASGVTFLLTCLPMDRSLACLNTISSNSTIHSKLKPPDNNTQESNPRDPIVVPKHVILSLRNNQMTLHSTDSSVGPVKTSETEQRKPKSTAACEKRARTSINRRLPSSTLSTSTRRIESDNLRIDCQTL